MFYVKVIDKSTEKEVQCLLANCQIAKLVPLPSFRQSM